MKKLVVMTLILSLLVLNLGGLALAAEKDKSGKDRGPKVVNRMKKYFQDEDQATWAKLNMAAANLKGLLKGDPDGKFRPNDSLKRIEMVVAAIRFANQEDNALDLMNAVLDFTDAAEINRSYPWGKGYLKQAAKAGLVPDFGKFEPGRPANRLWAAEVLVKALGQEDVAEAKQGAVLNFVDAAAIPADKVGYVQVALELGILKGYPDGTFKPFQSVTRAELAALLTRADENKETLSKYEVKGTVMNIVVGANASITIGDAATSSTSNTYNISVDVLLILDGVQASLADLMVGDQVRLVLNSENKVIVVTAQHPKEEAVRMSKHHGWLVELPTLGGQQVYGLITGYRWGAMLDHKTKKSPKSLLELKIKDFKALILVANDSNVSASLQANLGTLVEVQGQNVKGASIYKQPVFKVYNVQPIIGVQDVTPPGYVSTASSNANKRIILNFNETIVNNLADAATLKAAVTLAVDGSTFAALAAGDAVSISGSALVIDLAAALTGNTNKIKVAANTLKDSSGNVLASQIITGSISAVSITPLAYSNAVISNANQRVTLNFSEPLINNTADAAALKAAVTIAADGSTFAALAAGDAVSISGSTLVINLAAALTGSANKIRVAANTLKNSSGYVLISEVISGAISAADIASPGYSSAVISNTNQRVTLNFNETIVSNTADAVLLKAAVTLAADGSTFTALAAGDAVSISGSTLVIDFATALTGAANKVKVAANTLKDSSGNLLASDVATGSLSAADITPPGYLSAVISNTNHRLTLTFGETLFNNTADAAALKAAVTIAADGSTFNALAAGDVVSISGSDMIIDLDIALTGSTNMIKVAANTLKDSSGNILAIDLTAGL